MRDANMPYCIWLITISVIMIINVVILAIVLVVRSVNENYEKDHEIHLKM